MNLFSARESSEQRLNDKAEKNGTRIARLGEPVARNGGVQVDGETADGRPVSAWTSLSGLFGSISGF